MAGVAAKKRGAGGGPARVLDACTPFDEKISFEGWMLMIG
jgi:hypothetical protein